MDIKLANFIGQNKIKKQLELFIFPSLKKNNYCDHILLEGPAGTGKTTLAEIIALETNKDFKKIIAPIIKNKSDLISLFCDIEEGTIIFFDEMHRLDIDIEEMLYQIMDEKKINIIIGKEGDSKFITIEIPSFTIIGATTLSGLLSKPLKDRFPFRLHMEDYKPDEIHNIIKNNLECSLNDDLINIITKHSKNIPRIAINISKRINDYSKYLNKTLNQKDVLYILNLIGYKNGLDQQDLNYLKLLNSHGPMSINTIATKMSMEKINIVSDIEPHLLKNNYIELNSKGRNITILGQKLLQEIF